MPLQASKHLNAVVDALKKLPGVGPKAAQRMAFYLLQYDKAAAQEICTSIETALETIRHCEQCNNFSESQFCDLCASGSRDSSLLCVVEMPSDVHSIEQTQMYRGKYFVLLGRLSPLDGIGPKEIGLDKLVKRASGGEVKEVVVATNFTTEGEATAHYVSEKLQKLGVKVSRLSRGVPVGGEIEHVDSGTLAQSFLDRKSL